MIELGGQKLIDNLLTPTKIYVKDLMPLVKAGVINGISHITGGGFIENIPRMFGDDLAAEITVGTWDILPIFDLLEKTGIQFNPLFMSVKELQRYKKYCKQLEKNDIIKAESLIKMHFFDKVMDFMLENNCKLEQEIISWIDGREAEL